MSRTTGYMACTMYLSEEDKLFLIIPSLNYFLFLA